MDEENLYAPPVDGGGDGPPPSTGLTLSEQGYATASSMARWMRVCATMLYIFCALIAVFSLLAFIMGGSMGGLGVRGGVKLMLMIGLFLVTAVLFAIAATWLRQAALALSHGVLTNEELSLALGFRNLRNYLVLYGIWHVLLLGVTIWQTYKTYEAYDVLKSLGGL